MTELLKQFSDPSLGQPFICYQCDKPALVLNNKSRCIHCVTANFEKTEAEFELALEGKHPVQLEAAAKTDVFEEINAFAKELQFEIEHAVQVNKVQKVVTAGINLLHVEAEAPLFLSVDELRRLATDALKRTEEFMARSVKGEF